MKKAALYTLNLLFLSLSLISCSVEPKPVPYGEANCTHCNMTISDNRYGAELVTDKGKVFYFDAVECLAAYVAGQPEVSEKASFLMVTDCHKTLNNLVDAKNAFFLQSEAMPSPMGMNLTALADELAAKQLEQKHGGKVLTWDQVLSAVKNDAKFQY